jgi:hypothetical protein
MARVWVFVALWVGLALIATSLAIWFKFSTALSEILVVMVSQLIIGTYIVLGGLATITGWIGARAGFALRARSGDGH